jgi:hypothetical protein
MAYRIEDLIYNFQFWEGAPDVWKHRIDVWTPSLPKTADIP